MKSGIVIIHKGNQDYLRIAIKQALKTQSIPVFLLGDETNREFCKNHYLISDYLDKDFFKDKYVHLSSNVYDYELFCIQRWFLLRNFVNANDFDFVWALDSDILLLENLDNLSEKLKNIDVSVTTINDNDRCVGPESSYFTRETINKYCDFIEDVYTNRVSDLKELKRVLDEQKSVNKISDMTLLYLFIKSGIHYLDFGEPFDGMIMDDNISCPHGLKFRNGRKHIEKSGGHLYGYIDSNNEKVKFFSLHFQGGAKLDIAKYCGVLSEKYVYLMSKIKYTIKNYVIKFLGLVGLLDFVKKFLEH